jgi:hypothetical protein
MDPFERPSEKAPETTWKHDAYWGSVIAAFVAGAVLVAGLWAMQPKCPEPVTWRIIHDHKNASVQDLLMIFPCPNPLDKYPCGEESKWPKKIPGRE